MVSLVDDELSQKTIWNKMGLAFGQCDHQHPNYSAKSLVNDGMRGDSYLNVPSGSTVLVVHTTVRVN